MKKLLQVLLIVLIYSIVLNAQEFQWAKSMDGGVGSSGITTDNTGNIFVTGSFTDTATFGTTQLTSYGGDDIFIAKYDPNGNFLWVKQAGGTSYDWGNGITTDNTGNSFVTGVFYGTATFGTTQLTSYGGTDIFIAKYDTNGNLLWVKQAGGIFSDDGYGITTDNTGNSFVTGNFAGTATFGTTQLTSSGGYDIFIAKYDTNGNFLWVKQAGGTSSDYGYGITTDNTGNSFVTGYFWGTATFGTTQLTSYGGYDIFIAKYDTNGNLLWVKQAGGIFGDYGSGITTDNSGNCFVTGYFQGTATFGTTQLTSYGFGDIFIAKYDTNGNFLWVKQAGGIFGDYGSGITTDNSGNCFVTGYFLGTATFGTTQLTSYGGYDIFIAKYDTNGNLLWVKQAGGTGDDGGLGITTDNTGNCFVTGGFAEATFGGIVLNGYGGFITKVIDTHIIPVELNSLAATVLKNSVEISWATSSELNNKGFEIEKKINDAKWVTIGFVEGKGTTTEANRYKFYDKEMNGGVIYYRLKQIDYSGSYEYSNIIEVSNDIQLNYTLSQNYPNPFNPSTKITFVLPEESKIKLSVYNNIGEEIEVLQEGIKSAGRHEINYGAKGLSSGVYFYTLEYSKGQITKKMTLLR